MLAGLRVIEVADERAEYAGLLLAGLGAEVVKIEPPEGNATRRIGPFLEDQPGPERSLFGSDWPVCLLAAGYDEVVDLVLAALEPSERAAVMGGNAARIYRLEF